MNKNKRTSTIKKAFENFDKYPHIDKCLFVGSREELVQKPYYNVIKSGCIDLLCIDEEEFHKYAYRNCIFDMVIICAASDKYGGLGQLGYYDVAGCTYCLVIEDSTPVHIVPVYLVGQSSNAFVLDMDKKYASTNYEEETEIFASNVQSLANSRKKIRTVDGWKLSYDFRKIRSLNLVCSRGYSRFRDPVIKLLPAEINPNIKWLSESFLMQSIYDKPSTLYANFCLYEKSNVASCSGYDNLLDRFKGDKNRLNKELNLVQIISSYLMGMQYIECAETIDDDTISSRIKNVLNLSFMGDMQNLLSRIYSLMATISYDNGTYTRMKEKFETVLSEESEQAERARKQKHMERSRKINQAKRMKKEGC